MDLDFVGLVDGIAGEVEMKELTLLSLCNEF
jgi:hypothetical protein